jgi:hypothetical protein
MQSKVQKLVNISARQCSAFNALLLFKSFLYGCSGWLADHLFLYPATYRLVSFAGFDFWQFFV